MNSFLRKSTRRSYVFWIPFWHCIITIMKLIWSVWVTTNQISKVKINKWLLHYNKLSSLLLLFRYYFMQISTDRWSILSRRILVKNMGWVSRGWQLFQQTPEDVYITLIEHKNTSILPCSRLRLVFPYFTFLFVLEV